MKSCLVHIVICLSLTSSIGFGAEQEESAGNYSSIPALNTIIAKQRELSLNEQIFNAVFGVYEVLLDVGSGSWAILAPESFSRSFLSNASGINYSAGSVRYLTQSFGMMLVTLGMAQYSSLNGTKPEKAQAWLKTLLAGDVIHGALTFNYFYRYNRGQLLSFPAVFSLGNTLLLALTRLYYMQG